MTEENVRQICEAAIDMLALAERRALDGEQGAAARIVRNATQWVTVVFVCRVGLQAGFAEWVRDDSNLTVGQVDFDGARAALRDRDLTLAILALHLATRNLERGAAMLPVTAYRQQGA
ncbi:MAG TPA: hypothetical protein VGR62_16865 [Candidatus Binatia bacterium]|jgi:hypothetical protein|nr:hypothetical protein [Candidatus Binatia bacterium]